MKRENGITLIALIITIVILVILTAITINNVMSSDLFGLARGAAENYIKAGEEEQKALDDVVATMQGKYVSKDSEVKAGQIVEKTKKDNYTDITGKTATIPTGFKVSTNESEQLIDDGLVIKDEEGNEFVWIPCTEEQYTLAEHDVIDEDWARNGAYTTNGGGDGRAWRDNYTTDDKTKLDETYKDESGTATLPTDKWQAENQITIATKSIGDYGGFYIARYEAGVPEEANFHISKTKNNYVNTTNTKFTEQWGGNITANRRGSVADTAIINSLKPVSKKGVQAWNYITQPNAKVVSENMYKDGKDKDGNIVGVESYLIDSQAWNHICKNIYNAKKGQSSNDSTTWGNYYNNTRTDYKSLNCLWARHDKNVNGWTMATEYKIGGITDSDCPTESETAILELSTGASDDFKRYNIYDMAGNMYEWTTGHNISGTQMFVVVRGGSLNPTDGSLKSVVCSPGTEPYTWYYYHVGFRVVLYIK